MKLEDAIRKSSCDAARRRGRKGGTIVAMAIKGALRRIASLENPRVEGLVRKCDLDSKDWTPCTVAKEKVN